jgi:Ni/Co efflux regulator RcnB
MKNSDRNFLEKAGVTALGVPAAMMAGEMISDLREGQVSKTERMSKRDEDKKRLQEKMADKEPASSGKESLSKSPAYKKGGTVSSASRRADGCAIRGKTRA